MLCLVKKVMRPPALVSLRVVVAVQLEWVGVHNLLQLLWMLSLPIITVASYALVSADCIGKSTVSTVDDRHCPRHAVGLLLRDGITSAAASFSLSSVSTASCNY